MIERFTKQQFEAVLPQNLYEYAGFLQGEYCYRILVKSGVKIMIRSSMGHDGIAADTGEDSIRMWIVDNKDKPLGSKISRWISRVNGWDQRMLQQMRELWKTGMRLGKCSEPTCDGVRSCFKVKKDGPNKGRMFIKCSGRCDYFVWVTDAKPSTKTNAC